MASVAWQNEELGGVGASSRELSSSTMPQCEVNNRRPPTALPILRCVAATYFVALLSFYVQLPGLVGRDGLTPVFYNSIYQYHQQQQQQQRHPSYGRTGGPTVPTAAELFDTLVQQLTVTQVGDSLGIYIDAWLQLLLLFAMAVALSGVVFPGRFTLNPCTFAVLLVVYQTIIESGQEWMHFQWDILLQELGLVSIITSIDPSLQAPAYLFRVVAFKLMFMSGVVKIQSGCSTWTGLTALRYHFATQCIPTPLAWYAHNITPHWLSQAGVAFTLITQGVLSYFFLLPMPCAAAACIHVLSQVLILLTGNYNFFNAISIAICMQGLAGMCLCWSPLRSRLAQWPLTLATVAICCGVAVGFFSTDFVVDEKTQSRTKLVVKLLLSVSEVNYFVTTILLPAAAGLAMVGFAVHAVADLLSTLAGILRSARSVAATTTAVGVRGPMRALAVFIAMLVLCLNIEVTYNALEQRQTSPPSGFTRNLPQWVNAAQQHLKPLRSSGHWRGMLSGTGAGMAKRYLPSQKMAQLVTQYGLFRQMTGVGYATEENDRKRQIERSGIIVERPELILQGSFDRRTWTDFDFRYKPGDVTVAPPFVAPHQPRLDWSMWFAALYPTPPAWVQYLCHKLLENARTPQSDPALALLMGPMPREFLSKNPTYIRIVKKHYDFTYANNKTHWWQSVKTSDDAVVMEPIARGQGQPLWHQTTRDKIVGMWEEGQRVMAIERRWEFLESTSSSLPLLVRLLKRISHPRTLLHLERVVIPAIHGFVYANSLNLCMTLVVIVVMKRCYCH